METLPGDPYLAPGVTARDIEGSDQCEGCGTDVPEGRRFCRRCQESRARMEWDGGVDV